MYDWIIVGGGITGASLSYELQKAGCNVLLVEQHPQLQGASSLGYGGISYWSGTTDITQQLCSEGIARQRELTNELGMDTEFRDLDLLLTLDPTADVREVISQYNSCAIKPTLLNPQQAQDREPLLNSAAIAGALCLPHAHINLVSFVNAHRYALQKLGGATVYAKVEQLILEGDRAIGVQTDHGDFFANEVVICAGGISRSLLQSAGIKTRIYFTHAEAIDTPPVEWQLRSMVMPADTKRYGLEADSAAEDTVWDQMGRELLPASVDAGAIQFRDGRIRFGQLSRVLTDPHAAIDAQQSEQDIRADVGKILPKIAELRGIWRRCLVAFTLDSLPLVGAVQGYENLHLFSGFTSPTVYAPALSQRFAAHVTGKPDELMALFSPQRFW